MLRKFTCILICHLWLFSPSLVAAPEGMRLSSKVRTELSKIADYSEASKAMADRLPGVAADKFRAVIATPELSKDAQAAVNLMLAEALIRFGIESGDNEKSCTEALKILDQESLTVFPSTIIWRAEALASLGQYQEAEKALATVPESYALAHEAQFAQARILIALNQTERSLEILDELAKAKKPSIRNTSSLLAAEIYIDTGKNELALQALERTDTENAEAAKLKEYLAARLALESDKAVEAVNRFRSLITAPNHLSKRIFQACFLGLADAQQANNDQDGAITTLQQFITDHPNSYAVQAAFNRLVAILPKDINEEHPAMEKLRQWAGETPLTSGSPILGLNGGATNVQVAEINPLENQDLAALSLYYRAKLLTRAGGENNLDRAISILSRLRSLYFQSKESPSELFLQLFSASLLDTAYIQLQQNNPELATFSLSVMEKITFSPQLKNRSSILRGEILASTDDYEGAMRAFQAAMLTSSDIISETASINAGIMALKASNLLTFNKIMDSTEDAKIKSSLALERALWKCAASDVQGRNDLDAFIMANPEHPRENEARLALAAACVNITPPDITLAKAQLDIISPRMQEASDQAKITRIRIRAESLLQNWLAAAQAAEKFLTKFVDSPQAAIIQFKCGEAYYHNQDFNMARRIFQGFEKNYPENALNPFAKFYEAMAARLGGTAQSREECIAMFQIIIDSKHMLASEARIQQGRVLIDLQRYEEAEKTLKPLITDKDIAPQEKLGAGVLMADCLQRQGVDDPEKIKEAIEIYNNLLKIKNISPAWNHRLHYLRGQAFESRKQTAEAFKSYYSVILNGRPQNAEQVKHEEWFWFYRCGFKALAMLENTKRWEASVKVAKRIASFNGPRKEEAYNRAKELARTHMIWQDDEPKN